jgi:hypothetical protein
MRVWGVFYSEGVRIVAISHWQGANGLEAVGLGQVVPSQLYGFLSFCKGVRIWVVVSTQKCTNRGCHGTSRLDAVRLGGVNPSQPYGFLPHRCEGLGIEVYPVVPGANRGGLPWHGANGLEAVRLGRV